MGIQIDSMRTIDDEIFALQLKRASQLYHDVFDMNISPIEGKNTIKESDKIAKKNTNSVEKGLYFGNHEETYTDINSKEIDENKTYKTPIVEKDPIYYDTLKRDAKSDNYIDYNWKQASGVGVILGHNNYWALDIDGLNFPKDKYELELNSFISKALELLHLPQDYEWVVLSGSGKGLHIIFRAQTYNDELLNNVIIYPYIGEEDDKPLDRISRPFHHIELRIRAFLVLPPSKHLSGECYSFYFKKEPKCKPLFISIDQLYGFLNYYSGGEDELSLSDCPEDEDELGLAAYASITRVGLANELEYHGSDGNYYPIYKHFIRDEIPLLESCFFNNSAINSLGFLYARIANESHIHSERQKFYQLAEECFERSASERAKKNLQVLHSLELTPYFKSSDSIERRSIKLMSLKEDKLTYLKRKGLKCLLFDTETTGVPKRKDASLWDYDNWPRLVQIAYLFIDSYGREIASFDYIIKPDGFIIPKEALAVHGISTGYAYENGKDRWDVLREFVHFVDLADVIIGHNIDFDINIVGSEMERMEIWRMHEDDYGYDEYGSSLYVYKNFIDRLSKKRRICTMKSAVNYCKFPNNNGYGYRYPKLQELYKKLFGKEFEGAHNALSDIRATYKCFVELAKRGVLDIKFPL